MISPIFLWTHLFPRQESATSSYKNTVNSISNKVRSGIQDLKGGIKEGMSRINGWKNEKQKPMEQYEHEYQTESIGSRGYDEFRGEANSSNLLHSSSPTTSGKFVYNFK